MFHLDPIYQTKINKKINKISRYQIHNEKWFECNVMRIKENKFIFRNAFKHNHLRERIYIRMRISRSNNQIETDSSKQRFLKPRLGGIKTALCFQSRIILRS